ncbi:MAG TPA: Rne/Rng family ribonuclease [Rhizomicrobium sp.]|jgi:ribonuclease G|nr:Rne/Rng family ribonuclease [Rhizomicrobium sp.]
MAVEVLIHAGAGEIRAGLVSDGKLEELSFERTIGGRTRGAASLIGDIMLGRVQRVMTGMQAAFVDIGMERAGFLALRDARSLAKEEEAEIGAQIGDCVREGDAVLVQVIKDPIGEKGARLSAGVTLPGRLLVMTPGQKGLMLSRRIEDENQRAALVALGEELLKRSVSGAGFIFRTAALGVSLDELVQDALALEDSWRGIEEKRKQARPPATLHHDLGAIERTMRDHVRGEVSRVVIDDASAAEAARAYCRRAMPGAESLIELVAEPVFSLYGLEDEIAGLALPRVTLSSGAWITIETTEALTAIDVNSGRFTGGSGLEETSHAVNLEAAGEIGRQIRLRGIGGLIVVDFIHLSDPLHVTEILLALEKSLGFDRAPVQISPMSAFGIVAITRKRLREPLGHLTGVPCPACAGTGRSQSPESVALTVLARVEREARAAPGREILAEAAPDVAAWLNAHLDEVGPELARRGAGRVRFEPGSFAREEFDVRAV